MWVNDRMPSERTEWGTCVDLQALAEAVLVQRQERMTDHGPPLRGIGTARYQMNGSSIQVSAPLVRPGRAHEMVDRIIRYARERWYAISWTVTADRDDPTLSDALRQQGFTVRETLKLMGRIGPLSDLARSTPDITVGPVRIIEEMQAYERISSWGFSHQPNPSQDHVVMRGRERWDEQHARWYQYYLGRLRGEPASGAYVSLWERVPTIYGVVTLPSARNQGVAGQVMRYLVHDTLALGFPWTCLYVAVGNPAENLYRSLGYIPLFEQTTFQWGEPRW